MEKIIKNLIESGLTEKEARVYYALLSLGPTTVLRISQTAGTNRVSTYAILDDLVIKGLVHTEERGLKKIFVADNPDRLHAVMQQKMERVSEVIPDLASLYNQRGNESLVRNYKGVSHAHAVYDRIIKTSNSRDHVYMIGGSSSWKNINLARHLKYQKWLQKNKLEMKLLFPNSERAKSRIHNNQNPLHTVKILPASVNMQSDIIVTPGFVAIMNLQQPVSTVVIEDPQIVSSYKDLFMFMWESIQ